MRKRTHRRTSGSMIEMVMAEERRTMAQHAAWEHG